MVTDAQIEEALRQLRQEADSRLQLRRNDLEEQGRQAESDWREAIEALDSLRAVFGGSEGGPAVSAIRTGVAATNGHSSSHTPQETTTVPRDSGRNIVSKDTVLVYVHKVMGDSTVDIVTQTEIKDRILANQPVSKNYLNSLRVLIVTHLNELMEQGYLELLEKGRAGQPNKYRKTEKWARRAGESVLNSEP